MKTYRRHRCQSQHRTPRTFATCAFPRAAWILGQGPFAVLAWCRVLTVTLHDDEDDARAALRMIDSTGCGGMCARRHELVYLDAGQSRAGERR